MKPRPPQKGSERTEEEEGADTASRKRRGRNQQHRFSIHALINSKLSGEYNPYLIKKKREFYKNARFVSKYKKTLRQQNEPVNNLPTAAHIEDAVRQETKPDKKMTMKKQKKNKNSLQRAREEYEKRQEEEQKLRAVREAAIQAKREERVKAEARRKELRGKMFKRTQHGQPIMKYRIQHLLEGIDKDMN